MSNRTVSTQYIVTSLKQHAVNNRRFATSQEAHDFATTIRRGGLLDSVETGSLTVNAEVHAR